MADWRNRLADDAYNDEYSTADVLRRMPQPNPATSGMRSLADGLPANTENGLSILNMIKAGLGSAANWLDQRPELGPDTLAPLGLAGMGGALARAGSDVSRASLADWMRAKAGGSDNPPSTAMRERMSINPYDARWEEKPGVVFAQQPLPYPRYDYQVFGDKGRWMNDTHPALPTRSYEELSPGMGAVFDEAVRERPGHGAQPGLPQYPRIPSHWVPDDNPAKFTLRGPPGIADRATFTADSLGAMLEQIARTELKPSDRRYLEAMARQKFSERQSGQAIDLFADSSRASLPGILVNGLEQSAKGSDVDLLRRHNLEAGRESFNATGPNWMESGERVSPLGSAGGGMAQPAYFAHLALRESKGDLDAAMAWAKQHAPEAAPVLRYWHSEGMNFRPYADPPRSKDYWRGADEFRSAEPPARAVYGENETVRPNKLNAASGLPLPSQQPPDDFFWRE